MKGHRRPSHVTYPTCHQAYSGHPCSDISTWFRPLRCAEFSALRRCRTRPCHGEIGRPRDLHGRRHGGRRLMAGSAHDPDDDRPGSVKSVPAATDWTGGENGQVSTVDDAPPAEWAHPLPLSHGGIEGRSEPQRRDGRFRSALRLRVAFQGPGRRRSCRGLHTIQPPRPPRAPASNRVSRRGPARPGSASRGRTVPAAPVAPAAPDAGTRCFRPLAPATHRDCPAAFPAPQEIRIAVPATRGEVAVRPSLPPAFASGIRLLDRGITRCGSPACSVPRRLRRAFHVRGSHGTRRETVKRHRPTPTARTIEVLEGHSRTHVTSLSRHRAGVWRNAFRHRRGAVGPTWRTMRYVGAPVILGSALPEARPSTAAPMAAMRPSVSEFSTKFR